MDNRHDPTKLTSFQPLTPVSSSGGFSLSRIFDFGRRKTSRTPKLPATPEQARKTPEDDSVKTSSTDENVNAVGATKSDKKENFYSWLTESVSSQTKLYGGKEPPAEVRLTQSETQSPRKDKWRYRNVKTILRRLSALTIDRRWHQSTGDFKHNFKQYWMPDEHCKECYECGDKFNTFRRRHHCRVCGQIFCYRCCNQEVPGKIIGFSGDIRVCNYCNKIVQAYLNDDLEKSIEALSEDFDPTYRYDFGGSSGSLSSVKSGLPFEDAYRVKRTGSSNSINNGGNERSPTPAPRFPFDAFGVAPREANQIKQLQDYLKELWSHITDSKDGLELSSHRYELKTYPNCFAGSELVDWLMKNNRANCRTQAQSTGQALIDNGWIEHVYQNEQNVFKDEYMLYQPTKAAILETETASMTARLHATSNDYSDDSSIERKLTELDDDDDLAPKWFKQLSSITPLDESELGQNEAVLSQSKRFSAGRHLDLDHVTGDDTDARKADLSLQMNLDTHRLNDDVNKEMNVDKASKISLITHVPPLPLDTYVCVEGHQTSTKKKIVKPNNSAISEDILRGVVFPRPNTEPEAQEDNSDDSGKDDCGERVARERLSFSTYHHVQVLMQQLLRQDNLLPTWEEIIMPFISKISNKVVPDVRRDDDMDIRTYVWITNVPGGLKKDSHLISGVVFCKNVSHKRMTDYFLQPRILMMSCAIEYQRVENKMSSLDPLVLQEHAFLQNFVKRVLVLKPNILLVEKNVARVAQDMLLEGGVTLVYNIKQSKMENIARCTGANILSTMEQVTTARLGTCQQFRLQKYPLPKSKETKTLMYFDGCAPDLGCSLILRGGNEKTLIKVKKIIKYLIYVSYHLKLEAKFLMDEFAMPPPLEQLAPQIHQALASPGEDSVDGSFDTDAKRETENQVTVELSESEKFSDALCRIILTSSPFCHYFMPYLLTEEGKDCFSRPFVASRVYWSRYMDGSVAKPSKLLEDDHEWVENQDLMSPDTIIKAPHAFTDPASLLDCIEDSEKRETLLNDFRARGGYVDLKMYHKYEEQESQKVYGKYWKKLSIAAGDVVEQKEEEVEHIEEVLMENIPDPKHDCFDAYNHQKIAVLFTSYPSESRAPKPCITPWAVYMEFYRRNDITLGGFLERYCFRPSYICPSPNCSVAMVNHVRYFAHGKGSLYIHMRNLESPIPGYDRTILTWSWCKICKQVTPVVPLSFESYSMSFAKYLELRFYGSQYTRRASAEPCGHSLHHDHYQYFSYGNMVASFKYRAIDLYEVILPSNNIVVGKKRHPQTLVNEVEDIYAKVESFPNVIMDRLNGLKSDDPQSFSATREAKIKEFMTDIQKERMNLEDCVHVIKTKADNLIVRKSEVDGDSKSSSNATSKSEVTQSEHLKSNSSSGISSAAEVTQEQNVELNDDEKYLLAIDIGNKVFHLKKRMCESVENWNLKLQEFITQDRKREKSAVRSASPVKPTNVPTDITEFYPDTAEVEMDPARPKPQNRETVSEVTLTDGKILRQTYFGNTPSPHPGDSTGNDSPSRVRKVSGQTTTAGGARKISENNPPNIMKEKKDLSLQLTNDRDKSNSDTPSDKAEPERNKVGSPYMLISTLKETANTSGESIASNNTSAAGGTENSEDGPFSTAVSFDQTDCTPEDKLQDNVVLETKLQIDAVPDSNTETKNKCDDNIVRKLDDGGPIDPWIGIPRARAADLISEKACLSGSELSLKVECNSDQDDLSDNPSVLTEDDRDSNLPESEVHSEVEVAEEENDHLEDAIQLGESAVDFVERALSPKENEKKDKAKTERKTVGKSVAPVVPVSVKKTSSKFVPKLQTNAGINKPRSKSTKKYSEFPKFQKEEKVEKIEYLTPKEVKAMQVARRRRTEWENRSRKVTKESKAPPPPPVSAEHSKETLPIKTNHFGSSKPWKQKTTKDRKSNPLIKRLVQNTLDSTEGKKKGKITPVKQVTSKSKRQFLQSSFKPIKLDKDFEGDHPLSPVKTDEDIEQPLLKTPAGETTAEAKQPLSNYQKRKMMGHRRMRSAPLRVAPKEDTEVPSELTPESPFVFLNPMDNEVVRERSRSLGNKHVYKESKKLSKMAELVCHEDRVDSERDVPEVVQYDANPTTNITNIDGKTYVVKQQDDRKIEDDAATVRKPTKPGHTRHKSLQHRFLSIENDVTDALKLPAGINEAATVNRRGGSEKMKKIIANWLPGVNFQPIPRPFPSYEQYMPQVNGSACIVINEKEPTSLIAFTLSSQDYLNQLQNIQDMMAGKKVTNNFLQAPIINSQPNTPSPTRKQVLVDQRNSPTTPNLPEGNVVLRNNATRQQPLRPRSWADPNDGVDEVDSVSNAENSIVDSPILKRTAGVGRRHPLASVELDPIMDGLDVEDSGSCDDVLDGSGSVKSGEEVSKKKEEKEFVDHIKLQFQNTVARFYCSVYYAEQFRQLRELIFPEGEERFIQSLARCMFWKATGGKSGSSFSKSLDDRFVMKQMSRLEVQSFVDFAPRYFAYINKAIKEKRPTAMAKLLGVYRIGFKNSVTNTTMRQDVLVMENLFYEKKVNKIFDLKGSVRSRYVHSSVKEDVLMDENFLEMTCESPLFIRAHSKAVLSKAIYNDTEFLSTNMVMDYSLLVGIDEKNSELAVGIIDYIRTYTWDKKLESYVKSTGILGGQGKMPTVVSPEAYRDRYTQAMQRYFLMVPDKWTGFGADLNSV